MKKLVLIAVIIFFATNGIKAQVSFYQGELNFEFVRNKDFKTFGIPGNAICQFSIVDMWLKYKFDEKNLSFGDVLGVKGGASILGTSNKYNEDKTRFNMMVNFCYYVGGFVGYKYDDFRFFMKYYQEIGFSIRMRVEPLRYITNVIAPSVLYEEKYYLEMGIGVPAKKLVFSDVVPDQKDRLFRLAFRYYDENEENTYYGFTFERINQDDVEKITSFNITVGTDFRF